MKKIVAFLCAAMMLLTQIGASAGVLYADVVENPGLELPIDPETVPVDGTLDVQFENITKYDKSVVSVKSDGNASGGKVLAIGAPDHNLEVGGVANVTQPDIVCTINVQQQDVYYIWIRTPKGSSYYVSLDGGKSYKAEGWSARYGEEPYFWEKIGMVYLDKGVFEINIAHRYKACSFDRIVVTADSTFTPTGADDAPQNDTTVIHPLPEITPPEGHPRLYVTKDRIAELKENAKEPEMAAIVKYILNQADAQVDAVQDNTYNETVVNRIKFRALAWLIGERDDAHARQTIEYAKQYLGTAVYPQKGDITRAIGNGMEMGAIVYDWMYDMLTEDEKDFFIGRFKFYAFLKEIGYPPQGNNVYSHDGEQEIFKDLLSVGIAIYDEDPEIYNFAAGMYFDKMVPVRQYFNQTGTANSGAAYGCWRTECELYSTFIFQQWGIPDEQTTALDQWKVPMRWIYARTPRGSVLREGDIYTPKYFNYELSRTPWMMGMVANMFPDSPYNGVIYGEWMKSEALNNWNTMPFQFFLRWDKDNPNKVEFTSDLPLAYKTTYPITQLYARTSWQEGIDAPTAMAFMQAREKISDSHLHPDLGQFQIYYKGMLALDSGEGAGGGWLTDYDANYARRSIAHNIMTVVDPDEVFFNNYYADTSDWKVVSNDGGQDFNIWLETRKIETYEALLALEDTAKTKGLYVGPNEKTPEFSYIQTDLANAYAGKKVNKETGALLQDDLNFENKAGTIVKKNDILDVYYSKYEVVPKIKDYKRSMVFMDLFDDDYPAAFICFDKIDSSNSSFDKNWLLHTLEQPEVSGNTTVIRRTEHGFNGKMVLKTMIPEKPVIDVIGGEGKEGYVDGVNYPSAESDPGLERGSWRIEVSPSVQSTGDLFLNAMYVTDNDRNLPELPMYKEDQGNYVGVTVKDRVVMFSKDAEDTTETFSLDIRDNNGGAEMSVMVADVAAGMWAVEGGGKTQFINVAEDECALYFKGAPGKYTITPAAEGAEETVVEYPETSKVKVGDYLVYNKSKGLFLNQPKPVKLVDGVAYFPVETYSEYFGAKAVVNGESITVTKVVPFTITAGSLNAVRNGMPVTLKYMPKMIDGVLYAAFADFHDSLYISTKYDDITKVMIIQERKVVTNPVKESDTQINPISVDNSNTDGNVCENTIDGDFNTRWSADGVDEWLLFDLGAEYDLKQVQMAFYSGDKRATTFEILYSLDGIDFTEVCSAKSSGTSTELETFEAKGKARYVKIQYHGNTLNTWNSVAEVVFPK